MLILNNSILKFKTQHLEKFGAEKIFVEKNLAPQLSNV